MARPGSLPGWLAGSGRVGLSGGPGWPPGSGGQHPGAIAAGQAPADQVAQVEPGGAALEPGIVFDGAAVAELEPALREAPRRAAYPVVNVLGKTAGHADPRWTYWYLSACPELLELAAERLDATLGRLP